MELLLPYLRFAAGALAGLLIVLIILYRLGASVSPITKHSAPLQSINRLQLLLLLILVPASFAFFIAGSFDRGLSIASLAFALFVMTDSSVMYHFLEISRTGREARDTAAEMSRRFTDAQTNLNSIQRNVIELSENSQDLVDRVAELASFSGIGSLDEICNQMADLISADLEEGELITLVASTPVIGKVGASTPSFNRWYTALQHAIQEAKGRFRVITFDSSSYRFHKLLGGRLSPDDLIDIEAKIDNIFSQFRKFQTTVSYIGGAPDSVPYLHFIIRHDDRTFGTRISGKAIVWQLKPISDTRGAEESRLIEGSGFWVKNNVFIDVLLAIYRERVEQLGARQEKQNG